MIETQTGNRAVEIAKFARGFNHPKIRNIQKSLDRIYRRYPETYQDAQEYYTLLNQGDDRYPNRRKRIRELDEKYRGEDKTIRSQAMLLDRTIILLGDLESRKQLTNQ